MALSPADGSTAPTLQAFFTDRLTTQRQASPRTIAAYRDTLRLLLGFAHRQTGKLPARLDWEDLDATMISAFLHHLERERGNSIRTRNVRLTAIRSLFSYAALRHPEHAAVIQRVLAIPPKRFEKRTVTYLTTQETTALLNAPDRRRWEGRRDHAMLTLAVHAGLRVSELIGLDCGDIALGTGAHVRCHGKGRKQRAVPLTTDAQAVLEVWLTERAGRSADPLFPTRTDPPPQPRRRRATRQHARHGRGYHVGVVTDQATASTRAPAQLRDVAAAGRRRHHGDRALARTRRCPFHPALPARRPHDQRESARARHAADRHARPLQAPGRPPRLPRRAVTMPTIGPARAAGTTRSASISNIRHMTASA